MISKRKNLVFDRKCHALVEKIRILYKNGISLSHRVLHYINSTFQNPSYSELTDILNDDQDCERDSLLALLLCPDESFQMELEDFLESHDFQEPDEKAVERIILSNPYHAAIFFHKNEEKLQIKIPDWMIPLLISQLNICKKQPISLIETINCKAEKDLTQRVKVRLRNARFRPTENKVTFLNDFIEKTNSGKKDYLSYLDFILNVFEELTEDIDLYSAFIKKKEFYFNSFQKAVKFEAQLNQNNMETLMLRGIRHLSYDKHQCLTNMMTIDAICINVFGKTEYFEKNIRSIDLGHINRYQDINDIFI